jgi:hypothetical protein
VKLVRKCRDYRNAEDDARELLIAIEHNWMKTEAQLKFLTRIAESLGGEYLGMQARILAELEGKLKKAFLSVNQLSAARQKWIEGHDEKAISARLKSIEILSPRNKALYALTKTSLEAIVDDLEKWQARYDPTWMLILRMETAVLNDELSKECQKPQSNQSSFIMTAKEMRDAAKLSISETSSAHQAVWLDVNSFDRVGPSSNTTHPLLFSLARLRNSIAQVMVDTMHCNPMADIPRTTKEVCNLARILSKVDPATFGVLKCRGIIKGLETVVPYPHSLAKELPTFTFVFDVSPDLSNPRSLRSILQQAAAYSLNERFELAQQLTRSILYLHTARFVHKNIRPETIVVFQNAKSEIGAPFLLGFKKVRHEDGQTYGAGDGVWEKNLCMSNFSFKSIYVYYFRFDILELNGGMRAKNTDISQIAIHVVRVYFQKRYTRCNMTSTVLE